MAQDKTGDRINFFGARIDPITMEETLSRIEQRISRGEVTEHVVVNVAKLVIMQDDRHLRDVVNSCGIVNADGMGVVWGAKLLGLSIPERVPGIDLMGRLVELAARKGYSVYFLGGRQEIVSEVVRIYRERYPALSVTGFRDGYYGKEEEPAVVREIAEKNADMLFVAMSSPKKEIFLGENLSKLNVKFAMGVGGSFDVVAGKTKRAPNWMQKTGLEWFFRFCQEPGRMWRRYLVTNSKYIWMLITAKMGRREVMSGKSRSKAN